MSTHDDSPILSSPPPELIGTDAEAAWYDIVTEMLSEHRRKRYAMIIQIAAVALAAYRKRSARDAEDMTIRIYFADLDIPQAGQDRLLKAQ